MAYSRWDNNPNSLYVWQGIDGLHIWKPGQGDEDGLVFKNDDTLEYAKATFQALNDFLKSNGIETKIRAGKLTMRKARK